MISKSYLFLLIAILAEVITTTALARSESFTRLLPSVGAVVGYAVAFWFLSFPLRTMPTGIVYAIWSAFGIALVTAVVWLWSKQPLDLPAVIGLGLILGGVDKGCFHWRDFLIRVAAEEQCRHGSRSDIGPGLGGDRPVSAV